MSRLISPRVFLAALLLASLVLLPVAARASDAPPSGTTGGGTGTDVGTDTGDAGAILDPHG